MEMQQTLAVQESISKKDIAKLSILNALAQLQIVAGHQVGPFTLRHRHYMAKPLTRFFRNTALNRITPAHLESYQAARLKEGKAPATINAELDVLSMLLRRIRRWHLFDGRYRKLARKTPPVGRALSQEEIERLFAVAYRHSRWRAVADALSLALLTGMRSAEIRNLRWSDVSFVNRTLSIHHSKTPAGWRVVHLNDTVLDVLQRRFDLAIQKGFDQPVHFLFPLRGVNPQKPQYTFNNAWASIRKAAGVQARFHDCRHTAVTRLSEQGVPEPVIRAYVGHVSQQMMLTYSHPRQEALKQAASVLNLEKPVPGLHQKPQDRSAGDRTCHSIPPKKENPPHELSSAPTRRPRQGRSLRRCNH